MGRKTTNDADNKTLRLKNRVFSYRDIIANAINRSALVPSNVYTIGKC